MAALSNKIYIGDKTNPTYYFENEDIISVNGTLAVNLVGEELAIDTLTPNVVFEVREPEPFIPLNSDGFMSSDSLILSGHYTDDIRELAWATPVWYYNGGNYIGKYYIDSVERVGKYQYQLNCISMIGVLDKQQFYGGYYTDATFKNVVQSILLSNGLQVYQGVNYINTLGQADVLTSKIIKGQYKVTGHFYYTGIDGTGASASGTTDIACFFGYRNLYTANTNDYAVYANISRESTEDPWNQNIQLTLKYGSQTVTNSITIAPNTDVVISVDPSVGAFIVNNSTASFTAESFTTGSYPAILGCTTTKSDNTITVFYPAMQARFYELKVYDGSTLYESFIPCYKLVSPTKPGIYETVNRRWISRYGGSVEFGKGTDVLIDLPNFVNYTQAQQDLLTSVDFAEGVKDQVIRGWIPVCSKREALYQVMFSYNVNIIKGDDDTMIFTWMYQSEPEQISDSSIYLDGSIDYGDVAREVEVVEHAYYYDYTTDSVTLFDNTDGSDSDEVVVTFDDAPIYTSSLATTGSLVVEASNENSAIVSGTGTLTGKPYIHTQTVIQRINTQLTEGNTITVTDAYLVSADNSENVADRIFAYYSNKHIINNSIVLSGQKCGGHYTFKDPFGELCTAYLQKMTIESTSLLKANCEFVANYTPTGNGSNYDHYVLLQGSGTWTVPASVFEKSSPAIRVIMISGGQGGSSGYAGKTGYTQPAGSVVSHTKIDGGSVGTNGSGGRILTVTINDPLQSYSYSCGTGGEGGAINYSSTTVNLGSLGTDTTFDTYTTANGATSDKGVHNFFNGKTYASKPTGSSGVEGGDGGYIDSAWYYTQGGVVIDQSKLSEDQAAGITINIYDYIYTGGTYGATRTLEYGGWSVWCTGGAGGGAAAGQSGSNGGQIDWASTGVVRQGSGGKGGDATSVVSKNTSLGGGGYGGNGGGSGGDSGGGITGYLPMTAGTPGAGGYGGKGGTGGDGCIIIYY